MKKERKENRESAYPKKCDMFIQTEKQLESQLSPLKIELNTLHFVLFIHDLINEQNSGDMHSLIGRITIKTICLHLLHLHT